MKFSQIFIKTGGFFNKLNSKLWLIFCKKKESGFRVFNSLLLRWEVSPEHYLVMHERCHFFGHQLATEKIPRHFVIAKIDGWFDAWHFFSKTKVIFFQSLLIIIIVHHNRGEYEWDWQVNLLKQKGRLFKSHQGRKLL